MEKLHKFLNGTSMQFQKEFAERCGTSIGYMRKAIYAGQIFGARLCISIERETSGAVRCEDLDPAADWHFLRQSRG